MSGTKISQIGTEQTTPGTGTRVAASDTALPGQTLYMKQDDIRYWTGRKRVYVVGAGATLALTYAAHQDALIVLSSPSASFSFAPLTQGDGFRFEVVNISGVPFSVPAFAGATVRAAVSGHTQIANGGLTDFYTFTANATTYVYYANNTDAPAAAAAVIVATASLTIGVPPATAASTKTGSTVTATATLTPSSPAASVGSGSASLLAPITFEGTGAGANKVVMFAHAFPSGAVPAGTSLLVRRTSDAVAFRTQTDEKTYWGDGSLKHALMAVEVVNALADGSTLACGLWKNDTHASPGSTINLASALTAGSRSASVTISGAGTTYAFDLVANVPSVTRWRSGPLVSEARVEHTIASASWGGKTGGRIVADLALTKDGDLFVDATIANDSTDWPDSGMGSVNHSCAVAIDGTTVFSYTGKTMAWYLALTRINGRTSAASTANYFPCYVRHDMAYLHSAGASYRFDQTLGYDTALRTQWDTDRAASTWNTVLDGSPGHIRRLPLYLAQTGPRPDIGGVSDACAAWLMDGHRSAQLFAMDQAEAAQQVSWRYWDKVNGQWLDKRNRNIRTHPGDGSFVPSIPAPFAVDADNGLFDVDWTHVPAVMFVPYLLKGRRSVLDVLQAKASYSIAKPYYNGGLANFTTNAGVNIVNTGEQVRGDAWSIRDCSWAAYLAPTSEGNGTYWSQVMTSNATWIGTQLATYTADQGAQVAGYIVNDPAGGEIGSPPWQNAYHAYAHDIAIRQGFTGFSAYQAWMVNHFAGGLLQSGHGYPLNAMSYYEIVKVAYGAYNTTWATMGDATEAWAAAGNTTSIADNPANVSDYYSRLKAAGLAMMKDARPGDTTVSGAWTYITGLGTTLNGMTPALLKANPSQNIVPSGFTRGP